MLKIDFYGLIAHFRSGSVERAVLVSAPDHVAFMLIKATDVTSSITDFLNGEIFTDGNNEQWGAWLLDGVRFKFQNLPNGATGVDSRIPSLAEITDGSDPLLNIKNGVLHSRTKAYVDYSGGTLIPPATCAVRWTPPLPPTQGNLPSATFKLGTATPRVTYAATTIGKPSIMNGNDQLELVPDAVIIIGNLDFNNMGPHYKDYLGLLIDGTSICELGRVGDCPKEQLDSVPVFGVSNNPNSDTSLIKLPLDVHILDIGSPECTNTRFP